MDVFDVIWLFWTWSPIFNPSFKSRNGRSKMSRKDSDGSGGIGGSWCSRKAALRVASPLNLERELGVLR